MGTLTPEAGRVGRLLRVPLAEFGLPGIRAVSVFPPGDVEGELTRSGKCRNGRHSFRLYPLCQNDMSRKQKTISQGNSSIAAFFGPFAALGCSSPLCRMRNPALLDTFLYWGRRASVPFASVELEVE